MEVEEINEAKKKFILTMVTNGPPPPVTIIGTILISYTIERLS